MEYTVLDSLEALQRFYNDVNNNEGGIERQVVITSTDGEILLDETAYVQFIQKKTQFGTYTLHIGHYEKDGSVTYHKWIDLDLLIGWLVPKEGPKVDIAEIRLTDNACCYQLSYQHKESNSYFHHEHTGLEFFNIIYDNYWLLDDDDDNDFIIEDDDDLSIDDSREEELEFEFEEEEE